MAAPEGGQAPPGASLARFAPSAGRDSRKGISMRGQDRHSEKARMLAGELYDPFDSELVAARDRARELCQALNATRPAELEERRRILRELFGAGLEPSRRQ